MGMNGVEQRRAATVREEVAWVEREVGALVEALARDLSALGERMDKEMEAWRVTVTGEGQYRRAQEEGVRVALAEETANRVAFQGRGFWGRVGWVVRGQ